MSDYRTDVAGMAAFLQDRTIFEAPLREVAESIKAQAIRTSPVRTGDYIDSFTVSAAVEPTYGGKFGDVPRVVARVTNDSDHAGFVEYGNGRPGTRTNNLARAADAGRLA